MNLIEYKQVLQDNNIKLFDHDIRISYFMLNKYYNKEQIGGGNNIFCNKSTQEIKNIVDISLSPNFHLLSLTKN